MIFDWNARKNSQYIAKHILLNRLKIINGCTRSGKWVWKLLYMINGNSSKEMSRKREKERERTKKKKKDMKLLQDYQWTCSTILFIYLFFSSSFLFLSFGSSCVLKKDVQNCGSWLFFIIKIIIYTNPVCCLHQSFSLIYHISHIIHKHTAQHTAFQWIEYSYVPRINDINWKEFFSCACGPVHCLLATIKRFSFCRINITIWFEHFRLLLTKSVNYLQFNYCVLNVLGIGYWLKRTMYTGTNSTNSSFRN